MLMLRAALAAALFGTAALLVAVPLHWTATPWPDLVRAYWPVVLVAAGLAGLLPRPDRETASRRFALGLLCLGLVLLAGAALHWPIGPLLLAALAVYAGVSVLLAPRRRRQEEWADPRTILADYLRRRR